jgi:hypothetical protein
MSEHQPDPSFVKKKIREKSKKGSGVARARKKSLAHFTRESYKKGDHDFGVPDGAGSSR